MVGITRVAWGPAQDPLGHQAVVGTAPAAQCESLSTVRQRHSGSGGAAVANNSLCGREELGMLTLDAPCAVLCRGRTYSPHQQATTATTARHGSGGSGGSGGRPAHQTPAPAPAR